MQWGVDDDGLHGLLQLLGRLGEINYCHSDRNGLQRKLGTGDRSLWRQRNPKHRSDPPHARWRGMPHPPLSHFGHALRDERRERSILCRDDRMAVFCCSRITHFFSRDSKDEGTDAALNLSDGWASQLQPGSHLGPGAPRPEERQERPVLRDMVSPEVPPRLPGRPELRWLLDGVGQPRVDADRKTVIARPRLRTDKCLSGARIG